MKTLIVYSDRRSPDLLNLQRDNFGQSEPRPREEKFLRAYMLIQCNQW